MDSPKNWKTICFLVCVFATIREIRPIEPFFTSFLKSINFTLDQINENIYAVGTYSCLVLAVFMFLVTDYFRYKPLIVADGIAGIFTYALLLGTPSLIRVQIEQMFFGFLYSSEVAFTTYLYAKVDDKQYYQKITSLVKASILFGKFLSGLIAQIVVSTHLLDTIHLVYISIFSTSFVTIWALFLPKVEHSLYFHKNNKSTGSNRLQYRTDVNTIVEDNVNVSRVSNEVQVQKIHNIIFDDFKFAYSNTYVVKNCFWWIVAVIGHIIVATYIQVLWEDVNTNEDDLMNGAVESMYTLCGAAGAFAIRNIQFNWKKYGDIIFTIGTFIMASLLLIIYSCNILWILYITYIIFGTFYQIMLTIATSEVAKYIRPDSYGLIFGFNYFMSLLVISIFTLLFIQGLIDVIGTKNQILAMSLMFFSTSIIFLILAIKSQKK